MRLPLLLLSSILSSFVQAKQQLHRPTPRPTSPTSYPTAVLFTNLTSGGRQVEVGYRVGGKGVPLVVLNGRSSVMADWPLSLLSALAKYNRVYVFDYVGCGTSNGTARSSAQDMAEDTLSLMLGAWGLSSANVLGWSLGAQVAMSLAFSYPNHVEKLILVAGDPGGVQTVSSFHFMANTLDTNLTHDAFFALSFPALSSAMSYADLYYTSIVTQLGLLPNSFTLSAQALGAELAAISSWRTPGGNVDLKAIKQRTLVYYGTMDGVVPWQNGAKIASTMPNAYQCFRDSSGHGVIFQAPITFGEMANEFLRGYALSGWDSVLCG